MGVVEAANGLNGIVGKKIFFIINLIDGTEQKLTENQMMDRDRTNIGFAMTKGALYKDGD